MHFVDTKLVHLRESCGRVFTGGSLQVFVRRRSSGARVLSLKRVMAQAADDVNIQVATETGFSGLSAPARGDY